jgi:hypothetical protein
MGAPMVLRVASLVDEKPFPTLFWLIDKDLNYAIDQAEAQGLIARFQEQVDNSKALQARMRSDHQQQIQLRLSYISGDELEKIKALGFMEVLSVRGIGGIEDFHRIRCLHTYYAAHLVTPNMIGQLLDTYWAQTGVCFPHMT